MSGLGELLDDIARSGLVTPDSLERALKAFPKGDETDAALRFAQSLVQNQELTAYQARKLLAGATKGFFLGGYRILKPLGEGGMGKVFQAAHEATGKLVAIKVLPPKRAAEERNSVERFKREMELSQRVKHPNLAKTLGVGREGDVYFMILEYIAGESLFQTVRGKKGGPLRVNDTSRFFLKVLGGLEAAHEAGLVHRDIKPSNIMVTPEGDAKVLDLGLARAMEDDSTLTRPNLVIGTLDYISPEQLVNASAADRRSDLYSLGCTIYFTVAGRPPFEGGDMVNKIFKQRMEDPTPLEKIARGVPTAFGAIVRKLMSKNPDERYQDCAELRVDLVRWTDPDRIRAMLGAEADSARAFRPPPPTLDDEDLKLLADEDGRSPLAALRDLGEAEPSTAPVHVKPTAPVSAVVRSRDEPPRAALPLLTRSLHDDNKWLYQFIAVAVVLGLVAVLVIVLFA